MEMKELLSETYESDRILNKGIFFEVDRPLFLGGFLTKKKIRFTIKELYLGTLDYIDSKSEKLTVDEELLSKHPMEGAKKNAKENRSLSLDIVCYAILNGKFKIKVFAGILRLFLRAYMRPSDLYKLSLIIFQLTNYRDFMSAIRLMMNVRTTAKTTTPERIADSQVHTESVEKY